jgi:coenzyme F420-reducing hydrogenase delta subunit
MQDEQTTATLSGTGGASITVFLCANCFRGGALPSPTGHRPVALEFDWPFTTVEVIVACTGKIQPEHLLKSFEAGSDAVCVIACDKDNCHYLEGSRRAGRRVEHVARLLEEVSLGGRRVMLFHLPGSAREDMAAGVAGEGVSTSTPQGERDEQLRAIRDAVVARVESLEPNPLRDPGTLREPEGRDDSENQVS